MLTVVACHIANVILLSLLISCSWFGQVSTGGDSGSEESTQGLSNGQKYPNKDNHGWSMTGCVIARGDLSNIILRQDVLSKRVTDYTNPLQLAPHTPSISLLFVCSSIARGSLVPRLSTVWTNWVRKNWVENIVCFVMLHHVGWMQ